MFTKSFFRVAIWSCAIVLILMALPSNSVHATHGTDDDQDEPTLIRYTYPNRSGAPPDLKDVEAAINEILNEKLNVELELEPLNYGVFQPEVQRRFAAREVCDIVFTAAWVNDYSGNAQAGYLYPLDKLLIVHAPGLWASMPTSTWKSAIVGESIYGVINQQIFPPPWGVYVRKDLLAKYGYSLNNVTRWEDMEPFMASVKAGEGITPVFTFGNEANLWRPEYWGYDPIDDSIGFMGMSADDTTLTPVNLLETSEFEEAARITKNWRDSGYFPENPLPVGEASAAFRRGEYAFGYHKEKPGSAIENEIQYGWEFVSKNLTKPLILDMFGVTSTLNAICSTSPNPEKAMMVLEELNTNPVLYNLLARGIEGRHWIWADKENKVTAVTPETSGYNPQSDWMFGNQFNAYYRDPRQVGAWPATKQMNDTALPSTALGFVVDRRPIEDEIRQTNAVWWDSVVPIMNGNVEWDEAVPAALSELNAAGAPVILAEVKGQFEQWKSGQAQQALIQLTKLEKQVPIQNSETISVTQTIPKRQQWAVFSVSWPGSSVELTLVDPTGRRITPEAATSDTQISHSRGDTYESYHVLSPSAGEWQIELFGADLPATGETALIRVYSDNDPTIYLPLIMDR